ncbi:MAG: hypothetical protein KC944_07120 [Candidatus Omnitrophica bacterium]|nr:hypothetical protein [Candidatus Omnitrophota bacterium]
MIATAQSIALGNLQGDRERLVRLLQELTQITGSDRSAESESIAFESRKRIEGEVRALAARLVCHIDYARVMNRLDDMDIARICRATRLLFELAARQMYPESVDRFILRTLSHHLNTLEQRISPKSRSIPIQRGIVSTLDAG